MLTPDLDSGAGRSIEEAILIEHAKQMDEVGALVAAEPSLDQMARSLEKDLTEIDTFKSNASLLDPSDDQGKQGINLS
tara:strand:+ start:110395 stop:110628 length:234 start_codon:yes stop_codon:yes gene_type:complete